LDFTSFFTMAFLGAAHLFRSQNYCMYNLIKKQSSCKKKCAAPKNVVVKEYVKSKIAAKKWL